MLGAAAKRLRVPRKYRRTRFCQPRPGLSSSSFCTCRSIAMPQIAVKESWSSSLPKVAEACRATTPEVCDSAPVACIHVHVGLFTHHIQYTCMHLYLHRQPTTRMRIPWVQFRPAPNGRPRELRITHWFDEFVCRHKQVKAPVSSKSSRHLS